MSTGNAGAPTLALDELGQETRDLVDRVRSTGQPVVITEAGRSAAVLLDASDYGEQQRRLALLERIAEGEAGIAAGNGLPQDEVEALIDEWFGTGE
jgi:prevent-host-death family protein